MRRAPVGRVICDTAMSCPLKFEKSRLLPSGKSRESGPQNSNCSGYFTIPIRYNSCSSVAWSSQSKYFFKMRSNRASRQLVQNAYYHQSSEQKTLVLIPHCHCWRLYTVMLAVMSPGHAHFQESMHEVSSFAGDNHGCPANIFLSIAFGWTLYTLPTRLPH